MRYDSNLLNKYFNELKDCKPIDREYELELIKRIQAGDKSAENELITSNLRYVVTVAKTFKNTNESIMDLISEGNYGLIQAASKYDVSRCDEIKFYTYAAWWVRHAIYKYLNESSRLIRIPNNKINEIINSKDEDVSNAYARLGLPQITSLDKVINDDGSTIMDFVSGEIITETTDDSELKETISGILDLLDEREKYILKSYFGIGDAKPMTLSEISNEIGITKERVRQIKLTTINKIRDRMFLFDVF